MELFRDTHFDFLGRKWWFILPSFILTFAGLASLIAKGGPRYSIDFLGGAVMDVRLEGAPPIERIRAALSTRLRGVSVVAAHDLNGSNEILVLLGSMGGTPSASMEANLPDGTKLWADGAKYRKGNGAIGLANNAECGLANGLLKSLIDAMRIVRETK